MPNGEGGGILGGILQGLGSLVSSGAGQIWTGIYSSMNYAFTTVSGLEDFVREAVGSVKNIIQSIWDNIIKAALIKLLEAYSKLRDLLHRIFDPVLRILRRLRQIYDSYFNQFVRPILKVIRQIRQFLQIFKLLGFKWAKRLDANLADIENKIVKVYETLRQNLNMVTSWLQLIVDPTFLLRRNPLFGALIRSVPELRNLLLSSISRPLTPDEQDAQNAGHARYTLTSLRDRQNQYYSQGQLPPDVAASQADFQAKISAYVNQ